MHQYGYICAKFQVDDPECVHLDSLVVYYSFKECHHCLSQQT